MSRPAPPPSGIARLATLLNQAGLDLDGENLADVLWLAQRATLEPAPAPDPQATEGSAQQPTVTIRQQPSPPPPPTDPQPAISLSLESKQPRPSGQLPQSTVQAPAAPALGDTLSLGRALRPLMRKVGSNRTLRLDEEATAEQTAERHLCIPILRPAPERWLEVALVVEESRSALLWQEIITDFQRLLERQGAFRDVRAWSLIANGAGQPELYAKRHIPPEKQRIRSPKELIDPGGRRLIILISDCISPLWQRGQMLDLMKLWYRECPITILQMLPEKLWERSVLGHGFPVEFSALVPVGANAQLLTEGLPPWEAIDLAKGLKIPVITLDAEAILPWARVLAGAGNARAAGVVFDDIALDSLAEEPESNAAAPRDAKALVQRFQATASPLAQRLAGLMAMVPVSPPIIYLIQKTLLPESRQVHVAEIFMSGLLDIPQAVGAPSNPPRFQFGAGVREILRQAVPKSETEAVLEAISQYIAQKAGISIRSFTALLSLPTDNLGAGATDIEEFARLTRPVLRLLGGHYGALADALGDEPAGAPWRLPLPPGWPPIRRCEFEAATIEIDSEALTPFEFEMATLQISNRKGRQIEIIKETRQGQQRGESLGEDLILEMVLIPGGTFPMGSPENEPERRSSESPQHPVTVAPFFMGKYAVTQAQWRFVAGLPPVDRELNPDPARFKGANRPVEQVSWYEAVEFCARLSEHTQREYRLPSEAEWEYACRAGTETPFHFGETITPELANYDGNYTYRSGVKGAYREETTAVGSFPANGFGLYDMHGNVYEWCLDHWHENYEGAPEDGSAWLSSDESNSRMLRGGSWIDDPGFCRSANRLRVGPGNRDFFIGFRVVCSPPRALP